MNKKEGNIGMYQGVIEVDTIDSFYHDYMQYFTQDLFERTIKLPHKEGIKEITKLKMDVRSEIAELLELPQGKNGAGMILTGLGARVRHYCEGRIEYVLEDQSFHRAHLVYQHMNTIYLPKGYVQASRGEISSFVQFINLQEQAKGEYYMGCLFVTVLHS